MKGCPAGYKYKKGRCVPRKRFYTMDMGRRTYTVNWNDGIKTHSDGSDFYDIEIFHNKRKQDAFVKSLKRRGYVESRLTMYD
jgi:hypothetical protein